MDDLEMLLSGRHGNPFGYLGMHPDSRGGQVVRIYRPGIRGVTVRARDGGAEAAARSLRDGVFEAVFAEAAEPFAYELELEWGDGSRTRERDPYSFWPMVGELDQHLFNEGRQRRAWEMLGARVRTVDETDGVHFAVWAPNAERVSVVGDFNDWDGRRHPMRSMGPSGVWELFLPGLGPGAVYKYEILSSAGHLLEKADPFAATAEVPPRTGSVVAAPPANAWQDEAWMTRRAETDWFRAPVSIYEVHAGSWRYGEDGKPMGWRDLARALGAYVVDLGFSHVELMPVAEHPFDGSWGYQVTGYYAPTSRFGGPEDFAWFVDHLHGLGVGVIVDWVPGHFPTDAHGLARFDGTALYEHEDPRQGAHPDWGTLIFNFGRREVCSFLLSNALFWLERFHVDGLRVDAVASMLYLDYSREQSEWIPNREGGRENLEAIEFLKEMNIIVHEQHPGVLTLAEESTAWPAVSRPTYVGGLGFGWKWNMGWMNDMLRYMSKDPRASQASPLGHHLRHALRLHGELRAALQPRRGRARQGLAAGQDARRRVAEVRQPAPAAGLHVRLPGEEAAVHGLRVRPVAGMELPPRPRVDEPGRPRHAGVQALVRDLNACYRRHPALHATDHDESGFQWIDCQDAESSAIAFERRGGDGDTLVVICSFTPVKREGYRIGLPRPGRWEECLNTDAEVYGGSGVGNAGIAVVEDQPWHDRRWSALLTLPPLGVLVLRHAGD